MSDMPLQQQNAVGVVPSVWDPYMNRFRFLATCVSTVADALSDGAAGALIPYIEKHYGITYTVVSLIFVGQAIGFLFAAAFLDTLLSRLGRARFLALSQTLFTLAFLPAVTLAPFGVVVVGFAVVGFAGLQNGTFILGLVYSAYGVGGIAAPLIATAFVTVAQTVWSRYYLLVMGVSFLSLILSAWSFRGYEKETQHLSRAAAPGSNDLSAVRKMMATLKLRVVILGSIFIFAYQGAEISISGWVISFLINTRGGDPSKVGYITAGFWAGITLGRAVFPYLAQRFGEKRFVYWLTVGSAVFELLVWLVPNLIGEAVALAIVGVLLGPIYPCAANVFMKRMSRHEALSGMGAISAFGSMGGAVAPFVTGSLAQAYGTFVLHPIAIFLFVVMLVCWYFVPNEPKKDN
ncbi:hypothetical protein Golomagni_07046 [Golovinomyces magnicellulatus]|nr:hypothetical protein Golomagni_07046 [Golovinomyces magnicellulatus]